MTSFIRPEVNDLGARWLQDSWRIVRADHPVSEWCRLTTSSHLFQTVFVSHFEDIQLTTSSESTSIEGNAARHSFEIHLRLKLIDHSSISSSVIHFHSSKT